MAAHSSVKMEIRRGASLLSTISREAQRDAALLMCRSIGKDRAWLLAHPEVLLTTSQLQRFDSMLARRAQYEPIQYILGEQEFYGLRFEVSPAVLIPRSETEHLVDAVLERLPLDSTARVADIGTGSGAIAVALAIRRPGIEITALDLSPKALQIAARNAEAHDVSGRVRFLESDLLAAVAGERFDVIVSNPPYVATTEQLEPQVARWEPHQALFAGEDGLAIYRRLIPQARELLVAGGLLALEVGAGQAESVAACFAEDAGWTQPVFAADLQGIPRVVTATYRGK